MDRRVIRTKRALHQAIHALMLEKSYEDINVLEICERANIGRSTFYIHFRDKDELLVTHYETLFEHIVRNADWENSLTTNFFPVEFYYEHYTENREYFYAMLRSRKISLFLKAGQIKLTQAIEARLRATFKFPKNPAVPVSLIADFLASVYLSQMRWWFETDMSVSPKEMDFYYHSFVNPGYREMMSRALKLDNK